MATNETSLAKSIDRAALIKAESLMRQIKDSIANSVVNFWRPKDAGECFIGNDVRNVLRVLADSKEWRAVTVEPSKEMIDACRAHIINSLLSGLPKINELLKMSEVNNDE